jgi:hypothetical protein
VTDDSPVLGRPSVAAAEAAVLRGGGDAGFAAYRADGGDADWCAVRTASVAGVRHRLAGEPGQDSFAWGLSDRLLALAVADGLGTVPGSGGTAARAAVAAARAAVAGTVAAPNADSSAAEEWDAALTAQQRVAMALEAAEIAAGGGGATVRDRGASWDEVFTPPDDERDLAATAALPGRPDAEWRTADVGPADVLVLATDGVADPWRDGPTTVAPALLAAAAAHPTPLELARLAGFSRQGCHDDRTIVLFWLLDETAGVQG